MPPSRFAVFLLTLFFIGSPASGPDDGQSWTRDDMVSPPRRVPAGACVEASVTLLEDEGVGAAVGAVHHTPVKSRDIGIDMEAIRLSRQDNPYLQVGVQSGDGVTCW